MVVKSHVLVPVPVSTKVQVTEPTESSPSPVIVPLVPVNEAEVTPVITEE